MQRLDVLHHQVHHKEHRHRYKGSIMIDLNHYRRIDHRPIRDFIFDFFIKLLEINWLDRNARAIDQKIKYNKSNKSHNEKNLEEKKFRRKKICRNLPDARDLRMHRRLYGNVAQIPSQHYQYH